MSKRVKQKTKKEETQFKQGDLVGAKLRGYPMWPGYIQDITKNGNKLRYTVRFFGTDDTGTVPEVNLKLFKDFTNKEKVSSRKSLQEALDICQDKYDALPADKVKRKKHRTPEHSPAQSPEPGTGSLVIKEEHDDTKKTEVKPRRSRTIKQTHVPLEKCLDLGGDKPPAVSNKIVESDSLKAEGENRQNRAIEKLREKVDRKIAEKEARKIELKKMRQSEKASKVLIVINKNLSRLLQTLEKVRGSRTVVQSNQIEWNITVRKYTTALSLLGKCIGKHYFRENLKEDPHEYKQAREILVAMIQEIKRVKDSNDIPESVRNEVLKLKTMASKASDVKKFINQETDPKAAMIERKENDAK